MLPIVALEETAPHCINNPFGILEYPFAAIEEVPSVNVLVDRLADSVLITDEFTTAVPIVRPLAVRLATDDEFWT
jgi:hypothetical protein